MLSLDEKIFKKQKINKNTERKEIVLLNIPWPGTSSLMYMRLLILLFLRVVGSQAEHTTAKSQGSKKR